MKRISLCCLLLIPTLVVKAQTATIYRSGTLLSTHSSLAAASAAANTIGDSIVLSADIFREHDVPVSGGQIWQGTYTATDSTLIDAQSLGRVFTGTAISPTGRSLTIRDIIITNGKALLHADSNGGGIKVNGDLLQLKGHTIVRNCRASGSGGGIACTSPHGIASDYVQIINNISGNIGGGGSNLDASGYTIISGNKALSSGGIAQGYLSGHVQLINNTADSFGGGGTNLTIADSVLISDNRAAYGGGVNILFVRSGGRPGISICNNTGSIAGGAIYGGLENFYKSSMVISGNEAPLGAAYYSDALSTAIFPSFSYCYVYNPGKGPKRQNEIYIQNWELNIEGTWFGQSDTDGLIIQVPGPYSKLTGNYAIAHWSVNRDVPLGPADTVFPVGAAFTYSDGSALPANSCPWLQGHFSASRGYFPDPAPLMSSMDTLSSLFHTYFYTPGMSGSNPVEFLCYVDRDTFSVTKLVWGRDTRTAIHDAAKEKQVLLYPNPTKGLVTLSGATKGDQCFIYALSGQLVLSLQVSSPLEKINIAHLPAGQYLLKVISDKGEEGTARLLVQ